MTLKEADRLAILRRVECKNIPLGKAAQELGMSYRQIKRIWKRYKQKGAEGLVSLRRGRQSPNHLPLALKEKAICIVRKNYADYGPTLAAEKLKDKHKINFSRETLRKLMIGAELWKRKKRKERRTHYRRSRRARVGELIQLDGSYEFWFEKRSEKCCLIVFVDDATSRIMLMRFCHAETSEDYLKFLRIYLERYGRPQALYSDKHSIFRVTRKERIEAGKWSTRFHEALKQLDIELICAHSPEAKGRVERAHGTLQDRLIKELREREISSIETGNDFLDEFTGIYNKKFAVEPVISENAHRTLLPSHKLEELLVLRSERILTKDLSFRYKNETYQIFTDRARILHRKKIQIYELDGEIKAVMKDGNPLKYRKWIDKPSMPAQILDVKELEVFWPEKKTRKPGKFHPWR